MARRGGILSAIDVLVTGPDLTLNFHSLLVDMVRLLICSAWRYNFFYFVLQ